MGRARVGDAGGWKEEGAGAGFYPLFFITLKCTLIFAASWQFMHPMHILYYLHPEVSFFKGGGEPQMGPALDMPDNTASGDMWNPPDTESTAGISFDNCEAKAMNGPMMLVMERR